MTGHERKTLPPIINLKMCVISDFPRSEIRLAHRREGDLEWWDLRLWNESQECPGRLQPTKRGVCLRRHELLALMVALRQALDGAL